MKKKNELLRVQLNLHIYVKALFNNSCQDGFLSRFICGYFGEIIMVYDHIFIFLDSLVKMFCTLFCIFSKIWIERFIVMQFNPHLFNLRTSFSDGSLKPHLMKLSVHWSDEKQIDFPVYLLALFIPSKFYLQTDCCFFPPYLICFL